MANTSITVPSGSLRALGQAYQPVGSSDAENLRLSIRIADERISIRDLAAFLDLVDRFYGRLSENGLASYARRERDHLEISKIRAGSWELVVTELASTIANSSLLVIYLAVKYLPKILESISASYNNYEQGRLAREHRKIIVEKLKNEKEIAALKSRQLDQIADLVDSLYYKDAELLHRAKRFSERGLIEIGVETEADDE